MVPPQICMGSWCSGKHKSPRRVTLSHFRRQKTLLRWSPVRSNNAYQGACRCLSPHTRPQHGEYKKSEWGSIQDTICDRPGLMFRYNAALINNAQLPTEPIKAAHRFDPIFTVEQLLIKLLPGITANLRVAHPDQYQRCATGICECGFSYGSISNPYLKIYQQEGTDGLAGCSDVQEIPKDFRGKGRNTQRKYRAKIGDLLMKWCLSWTTSVHSHPDL